MDLPRRLALSVALMMALSACASTSPSNAPAAVAGDASGSPAEAAPATLAPAAASTPSPTVDPDAAATRYAKITTAMETAVEKAWRYGTRGIRTLAQFKTYHRAVYAALSRWDTNLRAGKYPTDTKADLRILLQRLSATLVLSYDVTQQDTIYWAGVYHKKSLTAWDSMEAAQQIVGKDLGLTYGP